MPPARPSIYGVGDPDEEQQREHVAGGVGQRMAHLERHRVDADVAEEHRETHGDHLPGEFGQRPQVVAVVPDAKQQQRRGAGQQTREAAVELLRERGRRDDAEGHRDAADARHRLRVHLARPRVIAQAERRRDPRQRPDRQCRHQQRDEELQRQQHQGAARSEVKGATGVFMRRRSVPQRSYAPVTLVA